MRRTLYLTVLFAVGAALQAQTTTPWTLQRAVEYALDNNLQVRQLNNLTQLNELNLQQARNARLPTASGSTNVGAQLGRTIDPTTNEFEQQTIGFQGYQLQAGVTLYNGGRIKNGLRQAEYDLAAARLDADVTANNVGLQVANSYLNVVLLREQLNNARAQLTLTEGQLANTDALIRAGTLPAAQRFDLVATQAANQRSIVELENQIDLAELSLKLLLELDYNEPFSVATPDLDPTVEQLMDTYDLEETFLAARTTQPTVAAAQLRQESAAAGVELARAGLRPTVSLFGSLSTNYSTVAKDFSNPEIGPIMAEFGPAIPVQINGQDATLAEIVNNTDVTFPNLGYFNQLERNFGQSVGLAVNVPIYSQGINKLNVQRAELQRLNAGLDIEQAENQLRNDVQLALANLRGAQQSYRAAQTSLEAAQQAADNAQRSFRAGAANSLDLVTANNRLEQARIEFTRAKYQLIFNRQVIRFYRGEGFTLE